MASNPSPSGISEPDWRMIFSEIDEVKAASEHWRVITTEMFERGTLEPSNAPLIERLIVVQALYDRSAREVAEHGAVVRPRKGNSRAIPRVSPHFTAMTQLSSECRALEGELGLSPATRGKVSKTDRRVRRTRAADRFLRVVK